MGLCFGQCCSPCTLCVTPTGPCGPVVGAVVTVWSYSSTSGGVTTTGAKLVPSDNTTQVGTGTIGADGAPFCLVVEPGVYLIDIQSPGYDTLDFFQLTCTSCDKQYPSLAAGTIATGGQTLPLAASTVAGSPPVTTLPGCGWFDPVHSESPPGVGACGDFPAPAFYAYPSGHGPYGNVLCSTGTDANTKILFNIQCLQVYYFTQLWSVPPALQLAPQDAPVTYASATYGNCKSDPSFGPSGSICCPAATIWARVSGVINSVTKSTSGVTISGTWNDYFDYVAIDGGTTRIYDLTPADTHNFSGVAGSGPPLSGSFTIASPP